ncbi:MAG TPA: DUF1059 domain-containing protein [Nitrosopumilaceae archaeon]|nr:DUF1059 domain-containing protein [Nitrosopumilaceae archaeon]
MTYQVICKDYGNECDFKIRTESESELVQKVKKHMEDEHGIDLPKEQIIQMSKL